MNQITRSKHSITRNVLFSILIGLYQHVFERNLALGLNSILVYKMFAKTCAFIGGISITTIEVIQNKILNIYLGLILNYCVFFYKSS